MKNLTPFQMITLAACVIGIVLAMLIFSGKLPIGKSGSQGLSGSVTVWGTLPANAVSIASRQVTATNRDVKVSYVQKNPATFQTDLVNALASGTGPDLVLIGLGEVIQNKDRIVTIPFASLPEATFKSTFVDGSSSFLTSEGVLAFPFVIDPLVMYYNRDILSSSFVVNPPATWDALKTTIASVTKKNDAGSLITETAAIGTYTNIVHAKELVTLIAFQAGNPIIKWDDSTKRYVSTFDAAASGSSMAKVLSFYTDFANASSKNYTWNAGLPRDRDQFIAGKLAVYFGYGSELVGIRQRNPNLNFDVAMMPQPASATTKMTYGTITGLAVMKMSKNQSLAIQVAQIMAQKPAVTDYLVSEPAVAPARRDMLAALPDNAVQATVYKSAIIARGWLDPNPAETSDLWQRIIGGINAGSATPETSIVSGNSLLKAILDKVQK